MSFAHKIDGLKSRIGEKQNQAEAYIKLADAEGRDLSPKEAGEVDALVSQIENMRDDLARYERLELYRTPQGHQNETGGPSSGPGVGGSVGSRGTEIRDDAGRTVAVQFGKGQNMAASLPDGYLGAYAKSVFDGQWNRMQNYASSGIQNTQVTTSNPAGGNLVPHELARFIVDKARAASVLFRAGAQTLVVESDQLMIPGVESDPEFRLVGEATEIPASQVVFRAVELHLRKRATLIPVSRELLEDGVGIEQALSGVMTRALATDWDNFIINGLDEAGYGLLATSAIGETDSVGDIDWEDISGEVITLRQANENPTSYIVSPRIAGDLDELVSGDATNSAKMWLGAPPTLEGVERLQTSLMPNGSGLVGDFTQLAIGLKGGGFRLEVSHDAEFTKDVVLFRLIYRTDYALLRPGAFRRLAGITVAT